MDSLTVLIKRAAVEAMEASKPSQIAYGKVYSTNPLKVKISEKLILTAEVLIVPEYLTDHEIKLVSDDSEAIYTVKNALTVGDRVIMIRNKGGQRYLILDRMVE